MMPNSQHASRQACGALERSIRGAESVVSMLVKLSRMHQKEQTWVVHPIIKGLAWPQ